MATCEFCNNECDPLLPSCEHCARPSKFPNVVATQQQDEIDCLEDFFQKIVSTSNITTSKKIKEFEQHVKNKSNAVLVRPLAEVVYLFSRENNLHQTFHQRLNAGGLHFDGGKYDMHRPSIDSKLFPTYLDKITFASLSLNQLGAGTTYGQCHMTLSKSMIEHRASLFKGNSFETVVNLGLKADETIPKGLRANWENKGKLAVAKNSHKFSDNTVVSEYASILNDGNNDFIEVHIYGSISHLTIERITICKDKIPEEDKLLIEYLKEKFASWQQSPLQQKTKLEVI